MTWRSIYTAVKIKPTAARNLMEYTFLCACGALWNAFDLYHVVQWSYLHGMMTQVDSQSFYKSLHIEYRGVPDWGAIPVFVIVVRILSRFIFWAGSSIILADYSTKVDRCSDGYRLVGFLWFTTLGLDIWTTMLATGQSHLYWVNSFATVKETLTILVLLSAVIILLFPRRAAKR